VSLNEIMAFIHSTNETRIAVAKAPGRYFKFKFKHSFHNIKLKKGLASLYR